VRVWIVSVGERPISSTNLPGRSGRMDLLVEQLCARGARVTWWSSVFDHRSKTDSTPHGMRYSARPGYEIVLMKGYSYQRNVSFQRLVFNYSMEREFRRLTKTEQPPDVILAAYPPIELVAAAGRYGHEQGVPTIGDVRDLWPDIWAEAVPRFLRGPAHVGLAPYFLSSRRALASMTSITGITEEFVDWGVRRAGRRRRTTDRAFPFGYKLPELSPSERAEANVFWQRLLHRPTGDRPPPLRLCFMGSIGARTGIHHVIEAVAGLPSDLGKHVQLVICGDGDLAQIKQRIGNHPSVVFAGWVDHSKVLALMSMSDLGVVPYLNTPDFQNSLSNKMIEYLAGGLAIITGLEGKLRRLLHDAGCGYTYASQDVEDLKRALGKIVSERAELERRKAAARSIYEREFRAETVYGAFTDHVAHVATLGSGKPSRTAA
jgi:glycosyltransferase involved in cell wall biosynthesis